MDLCQDNFLQLSCKLNFLFISLTNIKKTPQCTALNSGLLDETSEIWLFQFVHSEFRSNMLHHENKSYNFFTACF